MTIPTPEAASERGNELQCPARVPGQFSDRQPHFGAIQPNHRPDARTSPAIKGRAASGTLVPPSTTAELVSFLPKDASVLDSSGFGVAPSRPKPANAPLVFAALTQSKHDIRADQLALLAFSSRGAASSGTAALRLVTSVTSKKQLIFFIDCYPFRVRQLAPCRAHACFQ